MISWRPIATVAAALSFTACTTLPKPGGENEIRLSPNFVNLTCNTAPKDICLRMAHALAVEQQKPIITMFDTGEESVILPPITPAPTAPPSAERLWPEPGIQG